MTHGVQEAIAAAERLLPGTAAPDGERDPRWQAIIAVGEHVETHPEHLLERHVDLLIDRFEDATREERLFADAVSRCSPFGQSQHGRRAKRFARLVSRQPEA